jgi:hypothetical protein
MKGTEIAEKILDLVSQYGDLEVGFRDCEFSCFNAIEEIKICQASRPGGVSDDDESLGKTFIGIGW